MIFASPTFLFLFLPLFLGAYYATPFRWKSAAIFLGSSVFYAWWRADFLLLLYGIICFSWLVALGLERWRGTARAVWLLRGGIATNLLTLGYFKYWNFGVNSFFAVFMKAGAKPSLDMVQVLLPIGISFFVFHAISYLVDVWRQDVRATRSLVDFAAFIMLFPHLIAGPVLRYKDLAGQFRNRRHGLDLFSEGAFRFMVGFSKKVLIADMVAGLADAAFALAHPATGDAWLGIVAYTVQLYFDFSGYSDMAVGLALMMGFRFIENFNLPYMSRSITEFWRRWHISLSTWLRDYLYIPLGGSKNGRLRMYFNLFLTMLLGGLWHGANWTFLLWGAWHGGLLVVERWIGEIVPGEKRTAAFLKPLASLYCIFAVLIGWVLFRSPHIEDAVVFYKGMVGFNTFGISDALFWQIKGVALCALAAGVIVICMQPYFVRYHSRLPLSRDSMAMESAPPFFLQIVVAGFFLIAVTRLIAMNYSPFLYFQF
jgi:alginate O-acetyltransferase complex protein AlgI